MQVDGDRKHKMVTNGLQGRGPRPATGFQLDLPHPMERRGISG